MTVHIDFEPIGRRGEFPSAQSLLDCARQLGVGLVNLCGGTGSCGRCIVQIIDGDVTEPARGESEFLSPEELTEGYRLACQAVPLGDCIVRVPPESLTAPQRTQVEGEDIPVVPEPLVQTYLVTLSPPSLDDLRADAERLLEALAQQHGVGASTVALATLRELSPRVRDEGWQIRVAVRENEVAALLSPVAHALGLAVDLGTTKIAAYLVDLETGSTLATRGIMNPQMTSRPVTWGCTSHRRQPCTYCPTSPAASARITWPCCWRLGRLRAKAWCWPSTLAPTPRSAWQTTVR
jgi:uncharacterized 2Fe-2S/4Fe-4S cluster protein (DUF4445 family)